MNYLLLTCPCLKMILLSMYSMALARSVTKLLCPFELEGNLFSFEELRDLLANSRQGGWKIQIPVMSSLQMPLNAGATAIPPRSMTYKRVLVVHLAPINCLRELASFNHPYSQNQGKFVTFDTTTHHTKYCCKFCRHLAHANCTIAPRAIRKMDSNTQKWLSLVLAHYYSYLSLSWF